LNLEQTILNILNLEVPELHYHQDLLLPRSEALKQDHQDLLRQRQELLDSQEHLKRQELLDSQEHLKRHVVLEGHLKPRDNLFLGLNTRVAGP